MARNASIEIYTTGEVVAVPITLLGISEEHLVRPINYQHVEELVESDEDEWEPIEFRLWPHNWVKPHPDVRFHIISGNHRRKSADAKDLETIRGKYIKADSELEYMASAIRTNTRHGLNFAEDEKRANAAKLKELGMSGAQIAKLFGVHKSTANNWLSGRDTNMSRKQKQEPEPVQETPYEELVPRETIVSSGKRKVMSLLVDAQVNADIEEAIIYVHTLKPAQQELLHHLVGWLQKVIEG
ncbi:MAG TPA: helix-turn-helix domain-containing protein [Ktedonobacteraceae bacterium]|nr:helix-turn-helix domain-containing protein [Ktedonobacteraceae bacterium]